MTRSRTLAAAFLLLVAAAAQAAEYREFYKALEPISKLKDLKYLVQTVKVAPRDPAMKPESVVLTIRSRSGPIRIAAGPEGAIEIPVTKALYDENPDVESNAPPGTLGLSVGLDVRAPPAQRFDYRLVMDMKADWDEAVRRQNLMWRMLAPSARSAVVVFAPGSRATAEVRLPSGTRTLNADAAGQIPLPLDEDWKKANPAIVLSEMPARIGLDFHRK
jgi:hypothetical protein